MIWVMPGVSAGVAWDAFWASWVFALLMSIVAWVCDRPGQRRLPDQPHAASQPRTVGPDRHVGAGRGLHPDKWCPGAAAAVHCPLRRSPHTEPVDPFRQSPPDRLARADAGDHTGEPGRLLHGRSDQVPAFRWYEKETGKLLVANHSKDAAGIQLRLSDGRGPFADGGREHLQPLLGDAPTSLLTMSGLVNRVDRRGPSRSFATFFVNPYGPTRSVVLTAAEMIKNIHQTRLRQGITQRVTCEPA
jgi:hypothetical protein